MVIFTHLKQSVKPEKEIADLCGGTPAQQYLGNVIPFYTFSMFSLAPQHGL